MRFLHALKKGVRIAYFSLPMDAPLVTVVLPVYNRPVLVARAIASVCAQTEPRWELFVVDDGSDDDTPHAVLAIAASDRRIRLIRVPHAGPAAARNAGLRVSRAPWVAFLDSDDEYRPEYLRARLARASEEPDVEVLHGGVEIVGGEDRRTVPDMRDPSKRISIEECAVGGTFFCAAGAIERAGGWRAGYGEDADLLDRLARVTVVRRVDEPRNYLYHRDVAGGRCDAQDAG
jgi:glycosyltransferase involved in cell wall biosynthesis